MMGTTGPVCTTAHFLTFYAIKLSELFLIQLLCFHIMIWQGEEILFYSKSRGYKES